MLSRHTRPLTKVMGLPDTGPELYLKPEYLDQREAWEVSNHEGNVFTVDSILPVEAALVGFGVSFLEIDGIWPLELYRPLELPKCLTALLEVKKLELA